MVNKEARTINEMGIACFRNTVNHSPINFCHMGCSTILLNQQIFMPWETLYSWHVKCFSHMSVMMGCNCDGLPIFIFEETECIDCSRQYCTTKSNFMVVQGMFVMLIWIFSCPVSDVLLYNVHHCSLECCLASLDSQQSLFPAADDKIASTPYNSP